jgi:hypothetical protein
VLVWPLLGSAVVSLVAYFMLGRNLWLELLVDRTGQVIGAGLILAGLIAIQRSINSVGRGVHHGVQIPHANGSLSERSGVHYRRPADIRARMLYQIMTSTATKTTNSIGNVTT